MIDKGSKILPNGVYHLVDTVRTEDWIPRDRHSFPRKVPLPDADGGDKMTVIDLLYFFSQYNFLFLILNLWLIRWLKVPF